MGYSRADEKECIHARNGTRSRTTSLAHPRTPHPRLTHVVPAAGKGLFSASSLLCRHALRSDVFATSVDAGWTSVLIDQHRVYPDEDAFETHPTPDQTIVVMTRGEQEIGSYKGGIWRQAIYRAGTIGMTQSGETDRLQRRVRRWSKPFEKANLYVPQHFFLEAADHYRRAGYRYRDVPLTALAFADPTVSQTVLALLRAMKAGAPDLYAETAVQWLAIHLLSVHGSLCGTPEDRRQIGAIPDKRLARVLDYISNHLSEQLTLGTLAAEAGISKFHFSRLFRESTGDPPHAFVLRLRMEAAQHALATTDIAVAQVAAQCGFANATHFGTAFTKRFGVSPTAYRGGCHA